MNAKQAALNILILHIALYVAIQSTSGVEVSAHTFEKKLVWKPWWVLPPLMEVICTFQNMLYLFFSFFNHIWMQEDWNTTFHHLTLNNLISAFLESSSGYKKQTHLILFLLLIWLLWRSVFSWAQAHLSVGKFPCNKIESGQLKNCVLWFEDWNTRQMQKAALYGAVQRWYMFNAETNPTRGWKWGALKCWAVWNSPFSMLTLERIICCD